MTFHPNIFQSALGMDRRVRAALSAAAESAGAVMRPRDVLAGAIRQGDAAVLEVLTQALRPGQALPEVLEALEAERESGAGFPFPPLEGRKTFAPELAQALAECEAFVRASGGAAEGIALEALLHRLLASGGECARLAPALDAARARALFQEKIEPALNRRAGGTASSSEGPSAAGNDAPWLLPPEIAPSEDLTQRARTAALPGPSPFDGDPKYEKVFDALARGLHRRQPRHLLLLGERGVGKSTVLAELARRAATGRMPFLAEKRFLDVRCRYVPPDESRQRLAALLAQVGPRPELVVCLDGLAALLRTDRGATNKAVLWSFLAQARCRLIGLMTPRDYEDLLSDDPDGPEFFARATVEEPDAETALRLLRHFALGLEQRFRVALDEAAVRQAVTLSANYILNDHLPAKALRILHRVCEDVDYERGPGGTGRERVAADDVVRAVAEASGVPEETLRGIAEQSDYEQSLREVIVGQDHAVRAVATELGLIKAGMTDANKPASVMLFIGQTGTGKTEMAKALARFYSTSKRLKTYTLGNCVEPHSVATIIGVPPGYVGHDLGGRLVNELNADPYCVFLLDEADKAHPDVLQPFLNLFDEGWVCDQRGVKAYANKSIFILTTNVGQRMVADLAQQGKGIDEITTRLKEALSQIKHSKSNRPVFTPEFLSRLKRVVVFQPLDRSAMEGICQKLVAQMRRTWEEQRGKTLEVPEALVQRIAEKAHAANEQSKGGEGGRIVRKLFSEWVEAALQREISRRPREYQACTGVVLEYDPPADGAAAGGTETAPEIRLRFCRAAADEGSDAAETRE